MFNKLRNKFLILIMAVTSLVLITAFTVIYAVTYKNIQNKNIEKLGDSSLDSLFPILSGLPDGFMEVLPQSFKSNDTLMSLLIPSDYRPLFILLLDKNGTLVETYSLIDMSQEEYNKAAQKAWQRPGSKAAIRLNGGLWQYTFSSEGFFTISSVQGVMSIEGYMVTFLDITESHQTLQELLITFIVVGIGTLAVVFAISLYFAGHAVRPIRTAWEAQKQFIADASHELKTPLTIIGSNYGVLISKKHETIESQMKWLNNIKNGADRMDKLTADLLYLAKTDNTEINADTAPVNLSVTVLNEIRWVEAAAYEKGLTIIRAIEPDIIVNGDSEKLAQVVRILLDNAVKYVNENGVIDIQLKSEKHKRFQKSLSRMKFISFPLIVHGQGAQMDARYERHNVVFSIKNTGGGIAKEHLAKIFDRFYRADTSRTHNGGYGLGLSIAKSIIDNMGGKIYAISEEGKNTAFTIILTNK